jgi:hypothetical protein
MVTGLSGKAADTALTVSAPRQHNPAMTVAKR